MMMFSKNQGIARRLFFWLACGLACAPVVGAAASVADSDPLVIPQPKSLQPGTGIFIWPRDARWTLQAPARDERLWRAASEALRSRNGQFLTNSAVGL